MKNIQSKKRLENQKSRNSAKSTIRKNGFTLVETLVSISILVVSILGPMVIISQALRTSFFARDQITAFYLAQEAIEFVRNKRDQNSLTKTLPTDWLDGIVLAGGQPSSNMPIITDLNGGNLQKYNLIRGTSGYELVECLANTCPKVSLDKDTGLYGASPSGPDSIYTREVSFYKAPGDELAKHEITVEVTMSWRQIGGEYQFKLRENLTNWKIQNYEVI